MKNTDNRLYAEDDVFARADARFQAIRDKDIEELTEEDMRYLQTNNLFPRYSSMLTQEKRASLEEMKVHASRKCNLWVNLSIGALLLCLGTFIMLFVTRSFWGLAFVISEMIAYRVLRRQGIHQKLEHDVDNLLYGHPEDEEETTDEEE